jgi:cysteine-rich repeat protein
VDQTLLLPNQICPTCGDGVKQGTEQCDAGGNMTPVTLPDFGCDSSCQCEPTAGTASLTHYRFNARMCRCGNGVVEDSEECDTGGDSTSCTQYCENKTGCGDGYKIATEACDDRNTVNGDGCSSTCTIETNYTCIHGTMGSSCSSCGNGLVEYPEKCDGNIRCISSCNSVENGWYCSVYANRTSNCFTRCNDGKLVTGFENCDD